MNQKGQGQQVKRAGKGKRGHRIGRYETALEQELDLSALAEEEAWLVGECKLTGMHIKGVQV